VCAWKFPEKQMKKECHHISEFAVCLEGSLCAACNDKHKRKNPQLCHRHHEAVVISKDKYKR